MLRSKINSLIVDGLAFCEKHSFKLPPFSRWTYEDYKTRGADYDEIFDNMLGWDVSDFGGADYDKCGLLIFTLRNGNQHDSRYLKPYAEKILIQGEDQVIPMHFHYKKMEDIIVRGGGNLMITMYASDDKEGLSDKEFEVTIDGRKRLCRPGEELRLVPGESITLLPGQYHKFWAEKGAGRLLLGEVSSVNDDRTDNHFYDVTGRLPQIEEDEPILYPLFIDCLKLRKLM